MEKFPKTELIGMENREYIEKREFKAEVPPPSPSTSEYEKIVTHIERVKKETDWVKDSTVTDGFTKWKVKSGASDGNAEVIFHLVNGKVQRHVFQDGRNPPEHYFQKRIVNTPYWEVKVPAND